LDEVYLKSETNYNYFINEELKIKRKREEKTSKFYNFVNLTILAIKEEN